ncbi:MAG TPA: hypothetical protein VFB96_02320 [Pirellulaceae bacterium]|nr:hypothetical protein [Pirellulaceae bacterium]
MDDVPQAIPPAAGANVDGPLEAIVLEDPPVRVLSPLDPAQQPLVGPALAPQWYSAAALPTKPYVVPSRFGVSGILALMTGMALLFGFLRFLEAPPVAFLFLGTMALAICIGQMVWGNVPRLASVAVGAVLWPMFMSAAALYEGAPVEALFCTIIGGALFGAFMGYITGTCAAGTFLIMEKIDPYLPGGRSRASHTTRKSAAKPSSIP